MFSAVCSLFSIIKHIYRSSVQLTYSVKFSVSGRCFSLFRSRTEIVRSAFLVGITEPCNCVACVREAFFLVTVSPPTRFEVGGKLRVF